MTQILLATMIGLSSCVAPTSIVDGYCDAWGDFVPGIITNETWMTPMPEYAKGKAVFYGPYAMKATADYRGIDYEKENCIGGVSLMSPYNIGDKTWVKIDETWYGPLCVVDCAKRGDMYSIVINREEVIEINFQLAMEVGMVSEHTAGKYDVYNWYKDVEILVNISPEVYFEKHENPEPIVYKDYFLENLEFAKIEPRWLITLEEGKLWKEYGNDIYWEKHTDNTSQMMDALRIGLLLSRQSGIKKLIMV